MVENFCENCGAEQSHADLLVALQNLMTWKNGNVNVPPRHNGEEPWLWASAAIAKATAQVAQRAGSEAAVAPTLVDGVAPNSSLVAEMARALESWRNSGCYVCNGDCAGANPPVLFCPMQNTERLLTRARTALGDTPP